MIRSSFHGGHSGEFCCHAKDSLREVLDAYVAAGFTHVAITEHLPSRPGFLYPDEEQLGVEVLDRRFQKLMHELRPKLHADYDSKLQLFIGFETEFCGEEPLLYLQQMIEQYQPEVIVGSVHHVNNIPLDVSLELYRKAAASCGGMEEFFCRYYDQQHQLIGLLSQYAAARPVLLGHMDLIKLYASDFVPGPAVWQRILYNIDAAVKGGLVFDLNARAYKKALGEPYPGLAILQAIRAAGGAISLGDDSHGAGEVGLFAAEACAFARQIFSSLVVFEKSAAGCRRKELPL